MRGVSPQGDPVKPHFLLTWHIELGLCWHWDRDQTVDVPLMNSPLHRWLHRLLLLQRSRHQCWYYVPWEGECSDAKLVCYQSSKQESLTAVDRVNMKLSERPWCNPSFGLGIGGQPETNCYKVTHSTHYKVSLIYLGLSKLVCIYRLQWGPGSVPQ